MKSRISISLLLAFALPISGCVLIPGDIFGGRRAPMEKEVLRSSPGFFSTDQILVVDIRGELTEPRASLAGARDPGTLVLLKDQLTAAEKDNRIAALLLQIDSPGGGVTTSDLIFQEIREFKRKKETSRGRPFPVVATLQDIAASGGLYAAMAADEIYASPTTVTGSIGVIAMLPSFEGLSQKVGVGMRVIKSGALKDIGSPWREMAPADRAVFEQLVQGYYSRFLDIIRDSRTPKGLTEARLTELSDGRVFSGEVAAEAHLIDGILYPEKVLDRVAALARSEDAEIVTYVYPSQFKGNIYAVAQGPESPALGAGDLNLLKIDGGRVLPSASAGVFHYRWLP